MKKPPDKRGTPKSLPNVQAYHRCEKCGGYMARTGSAIQENGRKCTTFECWTCGYMDAVEGDKWPQN